MLAEIYIDNRVIAANKKATKETGIVVDLPAIAIRTYLGVVYAKKNPVYGWMYPNSGYESTTKKGCPYVVFSKV